MTNDELKVYIEKQIQGCKERIECFEEAKKLKINTLHQDTMIAMQQQQLDFYFTIKKDLEILEILKNNIGISSVIDYGTLDYPLVFKRMPQQERDKLKEWLEK